MNKFSVLMVGSLMTLSSITWANTGTWWNDVKNDRANSISSQIAKGADPNAFNVEGNPAIIQAIRDDSKRVFYALVENPKTNINIENNAGESPLMYAAIIGDLAMAKALVKRGAQVNRLGWAPLHYAAVKGHTDMVNYLLSLGAFPNAPAADGSSPIYLAVMARSLSSVHALLKAGADPRAVNQRQESANDLAKQLGLSAIEKALSQYKAK